MLKQLSFFEEKKYLLMSLREENYDKMLSGEKKYEYRTRYMKEESIAFIYISRTIKAIVAKIEFGVPYYGTAEEISMIAEKEFPGSYDLYMNWLSGRNCYAIPVKKIFPKKIIPLSMLKENFSNFSVPQSYYILNKKPNILKYLLNQQ